VEIYIEDQCLGDVCANESALVKRFGIKNGKSINRRLCALDSASSVGAVPLDPPDGLKLHKSDSHREADSRHEFVVGSIADGLVFFRPVDEVVPTTLNPEELIKFKRITVTKIEGGL